MVFSCSITKSDAKLNYKFSKKWNKLPFSIGDYPVYVDSRHSRVRFIYIYDPVAKKIVCELDLHPVLFDGIASYSVDSAYVDPEYQGNKIAFNLYRNLITKYKINLLTVGYHSPGAKKLWNDLAGDKAVSAYGIKADGTKVWHCRPDYKKRRLKSLGKNPNVYNGREGIGIFLTKSNSQSSRHMEKLIRRKPPIVDILKTKSYEFYATLYA